MEIFKKIRQRIKEIEQNTIQKENVILILKETQKQLSNLNSSNIKATLEISELKNSIKVLKNHLKDTEEKLKNSISHVEFLEPLFEKFKNDTLCRLELLNLSPETAENLKFKINKAEYSYKILELGLDIELKTTNSFLENIKADLKHTKFIKNIKYYKSG